jgi:hypothetical protein
MPGADRKINIRHFPVLSELSHYFFFFVLTILI